MFFSNENRSSYLKQFETVNISALRIIEKSRNEIKSIFDTMLTISRSD